jgi:beta-lactamase class A
MFDLSSVLEKSPDKLIAVAFQDLETETEFYLNADEAFHPASTIKVHVMMEVFRQANQGAFSLDEHLPILNSFSSIADGSPFSLDAEDDSDKTLYARLGEVESIRELTRLMIVRSGNLATNILLAKLGDGSVDTFVRALGIEGVTVRRGMYDRAALRLGMNNSATARGLTQTLNLLARKKIVSEQASDEMIHILLGQEFNESLPALIPNFTKVAHKSGWSDDVFHDTGIIYPIDRKPYVLTIMTRGFMEDQGPEAHDCMAKISRLIYEQLP